MRSDTVGSIAHGSEEVHSLLAGPGRCTKDADKLEYLLQAMEYRKQVPDTRVWIDTSLAVLKTDSAQRLAKLALERALLVWMHEARDSKPPK